MKTISEEAFKKGLVPYESPYLQSCHIEYPIIKADFKIEHSVYLKAEIESGHLNGIDLYMPESNEFLWNL